MLKMYKESSGKEKNVSREKQIYKVTFIGSAVNFLLLVFKFVAGIVGNSAAMIADAVHSLSDFITDIIVVLCVHLSGKPQDKEHDYGHGKYETMATVIVGAVLLLVGLGIMKNGAVSIWKFLHGEILPEPGILALIAALASIVLKELLFRYTAVEGKKLNSDAMIANAWHHRSDAFSSIGTAVGIGGAILLGDKWRVLDPVAAVIVSILIIQVSIKLIVPGLEELMEKSLPEKEEKNILEIILSFPEVSDPHHLRTRRIGNYCAIDVHVRMDKDMPLGEVHDITEGIESRLKGELGEKTIINIHVEPHL
ncbi:cation diffusion facilitator family transporter [Coprobacter secundus]|uniref:cation diffusion facilitator family transporter n=1 Tax=Coprobacter secundus TaxID=1501392 RepID=UPI003521E12B